MRLTLTCVRKRNGNFLMVIDFSVSENTWKGLRLSVCVYHWDSISSTVVQTKTYALSGNICKNPCHKRLLSIVLVLASVARKRATRDSDSKAGREPAITKVEDEASKLFMEAGLVGCRPCGKGSLVSELKEACQKSQLCIRREKEASHKSPARTGLWCQIKQQAEIPEDVDRAVRRKGHST